ncbi:HEAT repeat domain-containing protein [Candidatus Babeliales bacterium]|nr:HEAT repeat domain-containing protein [Candidatus Babeliales bacterium]
MSENREKRCSQIEKSMHLMKIFMCFLFQSRDKLISQNFIKYLDMTEPVRNSSFSIEDSILIKDFSQESLSKIKDEMRQLLKNPKRNNNLVSKTLEKISLLLVDEKREIRKKTVNFFEDLDPERFKLHTTEGNIIALLPECLKLKVLKELLKKVQVPNRDNKYKIFGIFWLGILVYKPAFPFLIHSLSDSNKSIVRSAIVALGIFGDTNAIDHLTPFLYETKYIQIRNKAIESIGSLGNDGLSALIHQLFLKGDVNPPFLESHIMTFGGRIMNFLSMELENEMDSHRKKLLMEFLRKVSEQYQVEISQNFKILL